MLTISFTTSGALRKSALREANERLVLDAIRRNPGISRSQIARITGFSRPSVTFVVNRLLTEGLVREEKSEGGTSTGRPPTALQLRTDAMTAVGVEIARPLCRVVLVDLDGKQLEERTVPWQQDAEALVERICEDIIDMTSAAERRKVLGVGISLPGTLDKSAGRVIAAETLGWFGVDFGSLFRRWIGLPLYFENDANLSALAEQWYARASEAGLRYFAYIRLQGGLGSGVVIEGRMLHGVSSAAPEFGHVQLYPDGLPCRCGNRGCWEQYASDAALVREYRDLGGRTGGDDKVLEDCFRIIQRARKGDARALQALKTMTAHLALGLVNVIAVVNPEAVFLGEPIASAWDLVQEQIDSELRMRVPAYYRESLRILPSSLGRDSALRGAAALALAQYFTRFDHTKDDSLPNRVSIETRAVSAV